MMVQWWWFLLGAGIVVLGTKPQRELALVAMGAVAVWYALAHYTGAFVLGAIVFAVAAWTAAALDYLARPK